MREARQRRNSNCGTIEGSNIKMPVSMRYGILFFLLFSILGGDKSAPVQPKIGSFAPPPSAMNFMKRFGYLAGGSGDSEALYKESAVIDAVKTLQKFGNIPVTGEVDNATLELIESPRCGVPDVIREEGQRAKRYIIGSQGWRKRDITYFIANWTPKLGEEPVADEIERAFDTWSGYSRLNFRPISTPNADIVVAFGSGPHGDSYPFDGPGNILAHAFFPYEMDTYGGDVHFDDDENWKIRPIDSYEGTDFFTVAVHELGHSLGLSHSFVPASVMFPYYKGYSSGFQLDYDDILAVYQLYITQPLMEDRSTNSNVNGTTESTTTTNNDAEAKGSSDEATTPTVSITTTEKSRGVTFVGDYETVDEHRDHEKTNDSANKDDVPDICEGNYDSLSVFRNELFIFKGQYVWRFASRGNVENGYPVNVRQFFRGLPADVDRVDASYERATDGSIVLFTGNTFWVYDGNAFIENSPRPLTAFGISADVKKLNAAQVWAKNGKTYLYSGDQFWRFNETARTLDPGYPRSMDRWRGVPVDLDAAMTWTDGITYFFKGTLFWRFDNVFVKTDDRYPLRTSEFWFSC